VVDVQAHYNITGELVQGGQLLQLHVPPGKFRWSNREQIQRGSGQVPGPRPAGTALCARHDSNMRPLPPQGSALSPELRAQGHPV
jgi:hypothetical protein